MVSKSCLGKIAFFILKTVETGYNTLKVLFGVLREKVLVSIQGPQTPGDVDG